MRHRLALAGLLGLASAAWARDPKPQQRSVRHRLQGHDCLRRTAGAWRIGRGDDDFGGPDQRREAGQGGAFVAGSHGTEYASIVALTRLIGQVDPKPLAGTVIVAPLLNVASFEQMTVHVNPIDRKGWSDSATTVTALHWPPRCGGFTIGS